LLQDFRAGEIPILFATKLAREGLDLPNMTQLFLTTPKNGDSSAKVKDGTAIEQEIGRVMRPDPKNKNKKAIVFDFVDYENGILKAQWYSRRKTYKRLEIKIPTKPREANNYIDALFPGL